MTHVVLVLMPAQNTFLDYIHSIRGNTDSRFHRSQCNRSSMAVVPNLGSAPRGLTGVSFVMPKNIFFVCLFFAASSVN